MKGISMIDFLSEAENLYSFLVDIRRNLHMHPELDRNLIYTSSLVEKNLKQLNIQYKKFSNCGIIGEIGSGENIVALRADMDALPILEMNDVPYKSQNTGVMHACGHDAHTSILIGTAKILKKYENSLKGRVRFIFQPAEETDGGARDMIDYGCLDNVKAICGLHVEESIDAGTVGINYGVVSASSNPFKITIHGKGAHGAHPEDGIDSIVIAAKVVENIQEIVSREISPLDSAVISIGKIHGGTAQNAICNEVVLEGIVRTLNKNIKKYVLDRMRQVVECTANMYHGKSEIEFIESYPSFENDEKLYDFAFNLFPRIKGLSVKKLKNPSMGVEDFSYYTEKAKGLYYRLGCRNEAENIVNPAHGNYFDIDERCLVIGCACQSMFAYNYLLNN